MESKELNVGYRVRYIGPTLGPFEGTITGIPDSQWCEVTDDEGGVHGADRTNLARIYDTIPTDPTAKDTNPKDAIGSTKLPLDLVPDTMKAYAALGFLEGATKYGSMNWRVAGVRASIYKAALERHLMKYWNGEWADPKTGVPHLASVLSCAAIILDANHIGKLTDDRPPKADLSGLIDGLEPMVKHLKDLHADKHPKHNYADPSVPQ